MIRKLLEKIFLKTPNKEERSTSYPIVYETYGILESNNPTTDTAYGIIMHINEDGSKIVFNKGK